MQNSNLKFRLICLPFVLVLLGTVSMYSLLHWMYLLSGADFINQDFIELFIPMAAPVIPVFIWLYPRFKLLKTKKEKDNSFNFSMIACLLMWGPLLIAQNYISEASGKLTTLQNVSQLNQLPKTKYYTISSYYIDKTNVCYYVTSDISGRYNETLTFKIYAAFPVLNYPDDNFVPDSATWLGVKYTKSVNSHRSQEQKEEDYQSFRTETMEAVRNDDFRDFTYLTRLAKSTDRDAYCKAVKNAFKVDASKNVFFKENEGHFETRTGSTLMWFWIVLAGCSFGGCLIYFMPAFNDDRLSAYLDGRTIKEESDLKSFFALFIPRPKFFITPLLIDINLAIYLVMVFMGMGFLQFSSADLLKWGADYTPYTTHGQWWRLVSSMFLHGGFVHILSNMMCLLFVGIVLEPALGRVKYTIAYFLTGISGSLASVWWHTATVSVGASGAIFGLFGVFLALLLVKFFPPKVEKGMLVSTLVFIGYNLIMGLTGGIDNAAHIGGLISGFILGFALYPGLNKADVQGDVFEGEETAGSQAD